MNIKTKRDCYTKVVSFLTSKVMFRWKEQMIKINFGKLVKLALLGSKTAFVASLILSVFLLSACKKTDMEQAVTSCHIVFEEGEGYLVQDPTILVPKGQNAVFTLQMEEGYSLKEIDYPDSSISENHNNQIIVTLYDLRYSRTITAKTEKSDLTITYMANGGAEISQTENVRADGRDRIVTHPRNTHIRMNTSIGTDLFIREGYTLTGWNTEADGSGTAVGLGSRIQLNGSQGAKDTKECGQIVLYAQWMKWTDTQYFNYQIEQGHTMITDYKGQAENVVIPADLGGCPVLAIAEGAFESSECKRVVFPLTLRTIEEDAFTDSKVEEIYLYDNVETLNDYSFRNCEYLTTLHINAVESPVYSRSYFATFQDKYDRLLTLKDEKKIVLFSGSSTRFGYDSEAIEDAFSDYKVVNMGVFAYTNALPQLMLIKNRMKEGDILLDSPEFDAAKRQLCTTADLDEDFFCMMEANYDTVAELDLRIFQKPFSSFYTYLSTKSGMEAQSYQDAPSEYDEDGKKVDKASYNQYGDYILYRANARSDEPVYGLAVEYTKEAFPKKQYLEAANAVYRQFTDDGIKVYWTYSPRNRQAISIDSSFEVRKELDLYLRENLVIPVISDLEESLYPGRLLYGTDNHLSTEGVQIRTQRIIRDMNKQMEREGRS